MATYSLVRQDGTGYEIGPNGLTIGRHRSNNVIVANIKVSRQHARVLIHDGGVWVQDLNSSGGTYVNGQRVQGQQEIKPGDALQVGPATYYLETGMVGAAAGAAAAGVSSGSRSALIFGGLAIVVIIVLALVFGSSTTGFPIVLGPTDTPTPPPLATTNVPLTATDTPPSSTPTPFFSAAITCERLDEFRSIRNCTVTNKGTVQDTLWLEFDPHRLEDTNDFQMSVVFEGDDEATLPDRKGRISLGIFEPAQEMSFRLQMYCVDVPNGCVLTTVQVLVLPNDSEVMVPPPQGEVEIKHSAGTGTQPDLDEEEEQEPESSGPYPPAKKPPTEKPPTEEPEPQDTPSDEGGEATLPPAYP